MQRIQSALVKLYTFSLCMCVYLCVCVCVFEWIIAIVFVYTCIVTICRRRYGHVSTAFRIPWIVYRTFLGRTITRSTAFTATSLLLLVFFLLKYLFFYILDPLWYIPPNWKNCTLIPILSSFPLLFHLSFLLIVRYLFASRGSSLAVHPLKHWKNYTSIHFDSIVFLFSLFSLIKTHPFIL